MRRTIIPHYTRTVYAENYMQPWQRHIVNNIVICALQKTRIDVAIWHQFRLSHTRRESHRMTLCYTYIIHPIRQLFLQNIQAASAGHRRRHTYHPLIGFGQVQQRVAKHLLP